LQTVFSALLPYAILGTSQTIAASRALAGLDRQNVRENEFIERSDIFIDGLRNAHAMAQAREKMEHQSDRLTDSGGERACKRTYAKPKSADAGGQCLASLGESIDDDQCAALSWATSWR
jgi:hypothetical protein